MSRTLYVTGTRRADGKTAITLGLTAALRSRTPRVGFMKPLGMSDIKAGDFRLDRDAVLFEKALSIPCSIEDMSPVTLDQATVQQLFALEPEAFSRRRQELRDKVKVAFEAVSRDKDLVVVEGSGHGHVGSVFGLGNAELAKQMDASVVIVVSGGVGQPLDEVSANVSLFRTAGVEVVGVVVNRAFPHEIDVLEGFGRRALKEMGVPLLGVVPQVDQLSSPSVTDALERFGGEVVAGDTRLSNVFAQVLLAASNPDLMLSRLKPASLLVTSGDRTDLLLSALNVHQFDPDRGGCLAGAVLTNGVKPHANVLKMLDKAEIPCILVSSDTYGAAQELGLIKTRIRPEDRGKIDACIRLVAEHVDVESLLQVIGYSDGDQPAE